MNSQKDGFPTHLFEYVSSIERKIDRVKRFKKRGGSQKIFTILEKRHLQIEKKIKKSHLVIYNNSSYKNLKKRLINLKKIL